MKTLSISEVSKKPSLLRTEVEKGPVRIVWKEPKPNGKVVYSVLVTKEELGSNQDQGGGIL